MVFLAVRYREELAARNFNHRSDPFFAVVNGRLEVASLLIFISGLVAFTWPFGLTTIALGVVIELFLFHLLWVELKKREPDIARTLATALYILAFGVAVGVDIVTLKGDIERMNTVFKFSLQAWQLFALASGYAAWYAGSALWQARGWRPRRTGTQARGIRGNRGGGSSHAGASLFMFAGTRTAGGALPRDGPTLDGFAFLPRPSSSIGDGNRPRYADWLEDDKPLIDCCARTSKARR